MQQYRTDTRTNRITEDDLREWKRDCLIYQRIFDGETKRVHFGLRCVNSTFLRGRQPQK